MIIEEAEEALFISIIQQTTTYDGQCLEGLKKRLYSDCREHYSEMSLKEFDNLIEEAVWRLLKYEVLYMIHGYIFQHQNVIPVGREIIPCLRKQLKYMDWCHNNK